MINNLKLRENEKNDERKMNINKQIEELLFEILGKGAFQDKNFC